MCGMGALAQQSVWCGASAEQSLCCRGLGGVRMHAVPREGRLGAQPLVGPC